MPVSNLSAEVYGSNGNSKRNNPNYLYFDARFLFIEKKQGVLFILLYKTSPMLITEKMFLFLQLENKHYL